jgi:hypothetical protein
MNTKGKHLNEGRELLTAQLKTANYPLRETGYKAHTPWHKVKP